jgi:hypothetical protein
MPYVVIALLAVAAIAHLVIARLSQASFSRHQ